jgi:RNA polymerase sigma-70 factor (ECF subfamily)
MLYIYLAMIDNPDDKIKFIQLHEKYERMMFGVIFSKLKHKQDTEDALQEALLKLAENIFKIDEVSCRKTESFLVILSRNTAIDFLRKNKRENGRIDIDDENNMDIIESSVTSDMLSDLISKEGYERLIELIESMDETYRDTMSLRFIHGYSNGEIAKFLGITKTNIEVRITRGKVMLTKMLKKEEAFYDNL